MQSLNRTFSALSASSTMAASSNSWKGSRSASPRDSTFAATVVGVAWLIVGLRGGRAWILFAPNPCPTRGRLLSIYLRPHRLREIRATFGSQGVSAGPPAVATTRPGGAVRRLDRATDGLSQRRRGAQGDGRSSERSAAGVGAARGAAAQQPERGARAGL